MNSKPIRVLVVDDSAFMRASLARALQADGDIVVVETAPDPLAAREAIKVHQPDVLTLDVEMPKMDGLEFLERLMRLRPMPVVMVSTLTAQGADVSLAALELGAVDVIAKPTNADFEGFGAVLREKIRAAAAARLCVGACRAPLAMPTRRPSADGAALIAIAASTGGVDAITRLLRALPTPLPPIVIAQHMPMGFTERFARRLDGQLAAEVTEAQDGMALRPGQIVIGQGNAHVEVEKDRRGGWRVRVLADDGASLFKPSADRLFSSCAEAVGARAIGVILTGLGADGAIGLKRLRDLGAATFGESAASAVIYGMPRAAKEAGAVGVEAPLGRLADLLLEALDGAAHGAVEQKSPVTT